MNTLILRNCDSGGNDMNWLKPVCVGGKEINMITVKSVMTFVLLYTLKAI